jgi:SLOG in TRPM, prokaryote
VPVLEFGDGHAARVARPRRLADVAAAVDELGLAGGRRVLVVVGGASGLDEPGKERLRPLFSQVVVPVARAWNAVLVDGGTDSGVMQLLGQAVGMQGASLPLVGVAVAKKVTVPGDAAESRGLSALEGHHTHFVLVPGSSWGDESPWLARVATEIAAGAPSVTVLINGGEVALQDVANSVAARRPVLVIEGTGRAADRIAAARAGDRSDAQAADLARSALVTAVRWPDGAAVRAALGVTLAGMRGTGGSGGSR